MQFLPVSIILWAVALGGWTFMWLTWSFDADVRSWIAAAVFPKKWLDGKKRSAVAGLSPSGFDKWLVSSMAPMPVCQVMTCRYCWSAHVSGSGTLLILASGALPVLSLPLVWACGAGIGNLIYDYSKRLQRPH